MKRLGQVFLGTAGFILAVPIIVVFPASWDLQPWQVLLMLTAKIGLGLWILLKSLNLFKEACFPPGSAALEDPVVRWFVEKDTQLWKKCWPLWIVAQLMLLFMPMLMMAFLMVVALRPLYVTMRHPQPSLGLLRSEGTKTLRFLWATIKGLFFLTLSTLMGSSAALVTFVIVILQARPH